MNSIISKIKLTKFSLIVRLFIVKILSNNKEMCMSFLSLKVFVKKINFLREFKKSKRKFNEKF